MILLQRILLATALIVAYSSSFAQSPIGTWKTIDDETGQAKSHVRIYKEDGKLKAKVVKLLMDPADSKCAKCPGNRKDKPIVGMVIMWNMEQDDDEWEDGTILDPDNGKTYDCKIWLEEDNSNQLNVRGYLGIFYRTQTWQRVN